LSLIDASAVAEDFTLQTAANGGVTFGAAGATATDFEVVGAKGDNTINLLAANTAVILDNDITVTTEDGDDSVTIDSAGAITGDIDVSTGKGDDTVSIGVAAVAHTGAISVDSGEGDDVVTIDVQVTGAAEISGGKGDDALTGGSGADDITGGDGDDAITGGVGADALNGGLGADTFVMLVADVGDTITSFAVASDFIDWNTGLVGITATNTTPLFYQAAAAGTAIAAATTVFELTGVTTAGSAANLVTALAATATNAAIDAADNLLIINYLTGGGAQIWNFIDASGADIADTELTLVATLTGVAADAMVAANFI
jgi:Ca2+-binding RTX toxin-like protein